MVRCGLLSCTATAPDDQSRTTNFGTRTLWTGSSVSQVEHGNFKSKMWSARVRHFFIGTLHKRKELYVVSALPTIKTNWALSTPFLAASVTWFVKFLPWNTTASASLSSPQFKHLGTRNRSKYSCGTSASPSGLVVTSHPTTWLLKNFNRFWNAAGDSSAPQAPQVMCAKVPSSSIKVLGTAPARCNKPSKFFVICALNWSGLCR